MRPAPKVLAVAALFGGTTAVLVADKRVMSPPESDASQRGLGDVVVRGDRRVAKEAAKLTEVSKEVSNRPAHARPRLEGSALPVTPAEPPREELVVSIRAEARGVPRCRPYTRPLTEAPEAAS